MNSTNKCSVNNLLLCSFNTKGQQNEFKRRKQYQFARDIQADILFLQETHSEELTENIWRNQWGGEQSFFSHGARNARGVSIHFKAGMNALVQEVVPDVQGRYLWVRAVIQGQMLGLCNIYAPNAESDQIEFYRQLYEFLETRRQRGTKIILGGDFNVVRQLKKDKQGGQLYKSRKVRHLIEQLLEDFELVDIWRVKNPTVKQFTWAQNKPKVCCRLDMLFISNEMLQVAKKSEIISTVESDHSAVTVLFQGNNYVPRGPGYWKLNTSVLQEKEYQDIITKTIQEAHGGETNDNKDVDPGYWWEEIKWEVQRKSKEYCKRRAGQRKQREKELRHQLSELEKKLYTLKPEVIAQYKELKQEFEAIYDHKVKGAMIRSRAKWIAYGEKNNKYFYGMEKRNSASQAITQLRNEQDEEIEDPRKIQEAIYSYYEGLYRTQHGGDLDVNLLSEFLVGVNIPKLSKEDRFLLEQPLQIEECEKAMRQMVDGKSPGEDGLPVEFYKKFWPIIKGDLFEAYKAALEQGGFLCSQGRGVIRLLPKPQKDLTLLKNWRPITLLTVDYKILSKALANRIKEILPHIISEDQAGFMKGRYIGEHIRCILEVADQANLKNQNGLLVALDIEKAFDSVEIPFLLETLKMFGFSGSFIGWIRALYTDAYACVLNNGHMTQYFPLERGVRQGDPVSPYLFNIAMEVLALAIRNSTNIEGFNIQGHSFKLLQFADDTTVLLQNKESLLHLKQLLVRFGLLSGLKINEDKTETIGLGAWKNLNEYYHGFKISPKPVKVLGIWFCHDKKTMHDLNVGGKLEKIKRRLNLWHGRGLTLQGKIMVVKTLGISQLTYPLINIHVPEVELKKIDNMVFSYIWGGAKKTKIKRTVLIQDYAEGGMKAPDIFSMYKVWKLSWLKRLNSDSSGNWKNLILDQLEKVGGLDYLLACNFDVTKLSITLPDFWQDVFGAYVQVRNRTISSKELVRAEILNNNRNITVGKKSFFKVSLLNAEMDEVGNWFDLRGTAKPYAHVKERVPGLTWMEYLQILSAIPTEWKQLLKRSDTVNSICGDTVPLSITGAKKVLRLRQNEVPTGVKKWSLNEPPSFWRNSFILARKMTKESKLQVLQYKVLHQIIPTQQYLYRRKVVQSPFCQSCHDILDTTQHMLLECPQVQNIWKQLKTLFEQKEQFEISIDKYTVIFGCKSSNSKIQKWNYLALLVKFYVTRCRLHATVPQWIACVSFIQYRISVLRYIAKMENKMSIIQNWINW